LIIPKTARVLKNRVKASVRNYQFNRALERIGREAPTKVPDRKIIEDLFFASENQSYGADPEYLDEVVRQSATTSKPILECGSGLTTILLGLFAGARGVPVWSLEHDPEWSESTAAMMSRYKIENIQLLLSPLRSYGNFSWYDPPLDRMPKHFGMVVCDGPPKKSTTGDRYGLLPVMRDRLGSGSVILLDDVEKQNPDPVLSRWLEEVPASYQVFLSRASSYAVITLG
jgi:predicted O-methyltransferase YrrM